MNANPLDRLANIFAIFVLRHCAAEGLQFWTVRLHLIRPMAVPTYVRRGNIGVRTMLHKAVTIAAIQPKLVHVDIVTVRDWLGGLVSDPL